MISAGVRSSSLAMSRCLMQQVSQISPQSQPAVSRRLGWLWISIHFLTMKKICLKIGNPEVWGNQRHHLFKVCGPPNIYVIHVHWYHFITWSASSPLLRSQGHELLAKVAINTSTCGVVGRHEKGIARSHGSPPTIGLNITTVTTW